VARWFFHPLFPLPVYLCELPLFVVLLEVLEVVVDVVVEVVVDEELLIAACDPLPEDPPP